MSDEYARRTVEPLKRLGLEGQKTKHAIDVRPHPGRPAGAPGPDARADIVDNRNGRVGGADLAGNREREAGYIDCDQAIRIISGDRAGRLIDAKDNARQIAYHRGNADDGDIGRIEQRFETHRLEVPAADAEKFDFTTGSGAQRRHQIGSEQIAQFFAGDDADPEGARFRHQFSTGGRPTMNRPS